MKLAINTEDFRVKPNSAKKIGEWATKVAPLYTSKKAYRKLLEEYQEETFQLQNMMYAHDKYAMLFIFQGMDTAGKDGAIKHVMSGINPAGVQVASFKRPSSEELDHDFLWRCHNKAPERGRIGIFNRSYYEDVLIVKVHPAILFSKRVPEEYLENHPDFWDRRYNDINNFESYLNRNGTHVTKFFIHISKEEQRQRFFGRIDEPEKNWKLTKADIVERGYWDKYQQVYQDCVQNTSTETAPWYVIPGDDKKNARLIISQIVLEKMRALNISYPEVTDEHRAELQEIRKQLEAEG